MSVRPDYECGIDGCPQDRVRGSSWCAHHRETFLIAGGVLPEPEEDDLTVDAETIYALVMSCNDVGNFVPTVDELAEALDCPQWAVRARLQDLLRDGRLRQWIGGPDQRTRRTMDLDTLLDLDALHAEMHGDAE